ncbi:MAG: hypothetical protein FD169_2061 [Bacillota bacterium]|nr:MAG: hypothetical protein FD169_2061 [Bacillota bacterium]
MWNNHRSVLLSQLSVIIFAVLLVVTVVTAPWLVRWLVGFSRAYLRGTEAYFLATMYAGSIPAAVLLYSLFRLLQRISAGQLFLAVNVEYLRLIAWSSFVGAVVCLVSVFYYFPWILVAVSAAFMGLIVRVVRNVVAQGVSLQDVVDHTV